MEQEVLRLHQLLLGRGPRQLPRVHPLPHDPGKRPNEGDSPAESGPTSDHHERTGVSGEVFNRGWIVVDRLLQDCIWLKNLQFKV